MSNEIVGTTERLCGALSDLGCVYEVEFDNRGGKRSRYIYVRKPVSVKIRVSDHRSDRMEKDKARSRQMVLDVGKHGLSWEEAVAQIHEASRQDGCPHPQR